jgi:Trk-type K+ transport system membrane component
MYFFILISVVLLLSLDSVNGQIFTVVSDAGEYEVTHGFFSNLSSALACISNIGPGFDAVSPYLSYAGYNIFSKIILTVTMIIGRLEILPVLILFSPKTWKRA